MRALHGGLEGVADVAELELVGVQRRGVQPSLDDGGRRLAHAAHVDGRIALVGVDDVQPAPVPQRQSTCAGTSW